VAASFSKSTLFMYFNPLIPMVVIVQRFVLIDVVQQ
jgi:hypothetical protein